MDMDMGMGDGDGAGQVRSGSEIGRGWTGDGEWVWRSGGIIQQRGDGSRASRVAGWRQGEPAAARKRREKVDWAATRKHTH